MTEPDPLGRLSFDVDVPPSTNNLYASIPYWDAKAGKNRCRRALTQKARNYKEVVGWTVKSAVNEQGWEYNGGRLAFTMRVTYRDRRRRDITNCIKVVEDAVAETLGFDDTVVDSFIIVRAGVDRNRPHVSVTLTEIL